jgi:hypothetical protein
MRQASDRLGPHGPAPIEEKEGVHSVVASGEESDDGRGGGTHLELNCSYHVPSVPYNALVLR